MGVITDHLDPGPGTPGTLILFFGGGLIALVLGLIVGAMRVSPVPVARAVGTVYVNWIRQHPLTLVMFFMSACSIRCANASTPSCCRRSRSASTPRPTSPRRSVRASTPFPSGRPRRRGRSVSRSPRS